MRSGELVGKREEKVSLGTRDPSEARIAHARVSEEVEARWRQLTAGVVSLTARQVEAIAGEIYRSLSPSTTTTLQRTFRP